MRKDFDNCTTCNVVWQNALPRLQFDVLTEDGETYPIAIQNYNTAEQLLELLDGKRSRAILACGMTDIDIYKMSNGMYVIDWSPCEGADIYFKMNQDELQKLISDGR